MLVKLEANWFGSDGRRYRKNREGDGLTFIPDELAKFLPSTAKIVEPGGEVEVIEPEAGTTLRYWDEERAQADAFTAIVETAEANRAKAELLQKRQDHAARMRAAKAAKKELAK